MKHLTLDKRKSWVCGDPAGSGDQLSRSEPDYQCLLRPGATRFLPGQRTIGHGMVETLHCQGLGDGASGILGKPS